MEQPGQKKQIYLAEQIGGGTIGSQTATLAVSGANGTTATWNGSAWTAVPAV